MASNPSAKKILAVDDNPVVLKALAGVLEPAGYRVFTALDASEAFHIVRAEKPDLFLLDIFFPPDVVGTGNTWDAFRILQWLKRMGEAKDTPVIVISVAEPEKYKNLCLAAGARAFLHKPVDPRELVAAVQKILDPELAAKTPSPETKPDAQASAEANPNGTRGENLLHRAGRLLGFCR
jgi:CheY-like chemotaxis protein